MNAFEIPLIPSPTHGVPWAPAVLLAVALALEPSATPAGATATPANQPPLTRPAPRTMREPTVARETQDPLPRIHCPAGFAATSYAVGLSSPDGLAFSPSGVLYVAEETAGRVSRIEPDGRATPVVTGLVAPEGIAFDDDGTLYVVEDVEGGRLLSVTPDGAVTTLAANLAAPEGVVWRGDDDRLYITESNAQFADLPQEPLQTHVTTFPLPSGPATRRFTDTWLSYAGIAIGPEGLLFVTNETSGIIGSASVFTLDPDSGARSLFASDLIAPEGLRFHSGGFPLYVAEEDTGAGTGRLSKVEADGSHTPFCTGFTTIEDVVLDTEGRLYVSEDGSGSIIRIATDDRWRTWLPFIVRRPTAKTDQVSTPDERCGRGLNAARTARNTRR